MSASGHRVEVRQSGIGGAGRGLFALQDFAPGHVVVAVPRLQMAEVNADRLHDTCAWCLHRGITDPTERAQAAAMGLPNGRVEVKACTGCKRVSYCSKTCQSKAWKREHKFECRVLAPEDRPDLPPGVRAVIKLLGRLKVASGETKALVDDIMSMKPFDGDNELGNIAARSKKTFDDYQMLAFAAWTYADKPATLGGMDAQKISRALMFNILCNTLSLASPIDDVTFGSGFDPLVCSANHSCDPNVVGTFNQPGYVLRALQPIKKGDEIFMKYIDVTNPFSVRQAELHANYFFQCLCTKCQKGPTLDFDRFAKPADKMTAAYCKKADSLIKRHGTSLSRHAVPMSDETARNRLAALQAEAFSVSEDEMASVDELREAIKLCVDSGMWSWTRQPVPQLCDRLFGAYVASADLYRAFRLGCKIYFDITPVLSPQTFSPDRLVNLWTLSAVVNMLCGPGASGSEVYQEMLQSGVDLRIVFLGCLLELHDNMPNMYGGETPFGGVVKNTYDQIMANIGVSEDAIRTKVRDVWPSLEMLARNVAADSL